LKDSAAVRSDSPFACLRVGTLLPINALVLTPVDKFGLVGCTEPPACDD
jgi:hypothetical protein